jgi:hypothetical protein
MNEFAWISKIAVVAGSPGPEVRARAEAQARILDATTIGVILLLWFIGGLICVGQQRTYRLGTWILGSGALVGMVVAIARLA